MRLNEIDGHYNPSFFNMVLETNEDISGAINKYTATFVHEFIHYIQDIILPYNIRMNLSKLRWFSNMRQSALSNGYIMRPFNDWYSDSGTNGQKPYNLLHLNALYDLKQHIYTDAVIQKAKLRNEHKSFVDMVDRSDIKNALVIADRGYESYNNMAHIQEKGWKFLIRVKDGNFGIKSCLDLPQEQAYDVEINLKLTRKQTKEVKTLLKDRNHYRYIAVSSPFDYLPSKSRKSDALLFYELRFRVVRFWIGDGTFETVLANLDGQTYPPQKLKELYADRWGIETAFRDLKYTLGMLHFHSKKVMCIQQEIYAHLIMYNFSEMITSHVVIKQKERRHTYKANFSVAVHMCRLFYHRKITSPVLEAIISRNVIPVRPNRHGIRKNSDKSFKGFLYRIA